MSDFFQKGKKKKRLDFQTIVIFILFFHDFYVTSALSPCSQAHKYKMDFGTLLPM